jgi:preprotein translocase subunit SecD
VSFILRTFFIAAVLTTAAFSVAAESIAVQVTSAEVAFDRRTNEPLISFRMSEKSTQMFGELTSRNVGKKLAIRVDGRTISAPVIREPILGGSGQISGDLSREDAKAIADRLSSGKANLVFEIVP